MTDSGRGLIKALENWAKRVTAGYRDVEVRDLSTSFRDGLAFCAIVHHYRPDLIDFDSLSKEKILENNSLAFSVAEKQLGVPSLLDAEDMLTYHVPDRLSIITYLSQLRNCFENQNKVNKRPSLRKIQKSSLEAKVFSPPSVLPSVSRRHEVCQVCRHRVFILERLMVDGKLYHTTCFRCHKCNALLNPGAYVESDEAPGQYECSVCTTEDEDNNTADDAHTVQEDTTRTFPEERVSTPALPAAPTTREWGAVDFARSNLSTENGIASVKEKISVFENNQVKENLSPKPSRTKYSPLSNRFSPQPLSVTPTNLSETPTKSPASPEKSNIQTIDSQKSVEGNVSPSPKMPTFTEKENITHPVDEPPGRVSRDIFKSSLAPLKLTLLPSARKESNEPSSVVKLKSTYPLTLLHSKSMQNHLSGSLPDVESNQPAVLNSDKTDRRSSLESEREDSSARASTKWMRPDLHSLQRSTSSVEMSSVLKNHRMPQFKSLQSTLSSSEKSPTTNLLSSKMNKSDTVADSVMKVRGSYSPLSLRNISLSSKMSKSESENIAESSVKKISGSYSSLSPSMTPSSEMNKKSESENTADSAIKISSSYLSVSPRISPKSEISGLEVPSLSKDISSQSSSPVPGTDQEDGAKQYPDDLNPFGDEEENDEDYPDDLNPFGDEDGPEDADSRDAAYDESKNPFASDEDDDPKTPDGSLRPSLQDTSMSSNISSPSGSLKGTIRKRLAPKPPTVSEIFAKDPPDATPKKNLQTPSPKVFRKNKPAPLPPPLSQDPAANRKMAKETNNNKLKMAAASEDKHQVFKKKKRPAPPVPIPARRDMKAIPLKEIMQEMKEIEEKQREYERQGREIELLIRDRDKDEEASVEEEEYIMQLFELVNQKNALFRRQAELMYIKRSQRLEEQQYQIEKEIRQLMEKPDCDKTPEDRHKEEELTLELLDIVDQRNSIIDSIEMDRRRELEEDHSVQEQLEIKNGDLPITAEIKQKSGKNKKNKQKNKKKKEEGEKGGTPKIKKRLFSKRS